MYAKTLFSLALSLLLVGCAAQQTPTTVGPNLKPTMFFNITAGPEDPHEVTMALQLAGHALKDGRTVVLFFNVEGVKIPLNSLPADLAFKDKPIKQLLADRITEGAKVHVCPHCMKAMEVTEKDLIKGAQVTTRASLFGHLTSDTIVFSY